MFVAQLSTDTNTNAQIVANFKQGIDGASIDFERFVDVATFTGIEKLRMVEHVQAGKKTLRFSWLSLRDLTEITNKSMIEEQIT